MRSEGQTPDISYFMKNNVFPTRMCTDLYTEDEFDKGNNIFKDVDVLKIQTNPEMKQLFENQNGDAMDLQKDSVDSYTSTEKLRQRASMFQLDPQAKDYNQVAGKGIVVQNNIESAPALTEDFFGNPIETGKAIDIGAHQCSSMDHYTEVTSQQKVLVTTKAGQYPALPAQIDVTLVDHIGDTTSDPYQKSVNVQWETVQPEQYAKEGTFSLEGKAVVPGIAEPVTVTAEITVTKAESDGSIRKSIVVSADTYLESGNGDKAYGGMEGTLTKAGASEAEKAPFEYTATNNYTLKVKNATNTSYNRRTVLKFDLGDVMNQLDQLDKATIQLTVDRYDVYGDAGFDGTWRRLDVYDVTDNWDETTATWNNLEDNKKASANHGTPGQKETQEPTYKEYQPIAHVELTNRQIKENGNVVEIDVLNYLKSLPKDTKEVSFLIDTPYSSNPASNVDNGGFDAFSKEGAAGMAQYGYGETELAPKLYLSNAWVTNVESPDVLTKMGEVPELPKTVEVTWSDGTTSMEKVTWGNVDSTQYDHENMFTVSGSISGINNPVVANVTVRADHLVGWSTLPAMEKPLGTTVDFLGLPNEITVQVEDYKTQQISDVTLPVNYWSNNEVAYNPQTTTRQEVLAYYDIPDGMIVNENVRLAVDVYLYGSRNLSVTAHGDSSVVVPGKEIRLIAEMYAFEQYQDIEWTLTGNTSQDTKLIPAEEVMKAENEEKTMLPVQPIDETNSQAATSGDTQEATPQPTSNSIASVPDSNADLQAEPSQNCDTSQAVQTNPEKLEPTSDGINEDVELQEASEPQVDYDNSACEKEESQDVDVIAENMSVGYQPVAQSQTMDAEVVQTQEDGTSLVQEEMILVIGADETSDSIQVAVKADGLLTNATEEEKAEQSITVGVQKPEPTAIPTATPTPTPAVTETPAATDTPQPTATPDNTNNRDNTEGSNNAANPKPTDVPTAVPTPTITPPKYTHVPDSMIISETTESPEPSASATAAPSDKPASSSKQEPTPSSSSVESNLEVEQQNKNYTGVIAACVIVVLVIAAGAAVYVIQHKRNEQ